MQNALESEGWTVWWDPKLRAGEHFDDVIEKALNEAKCVIVMWSERSVQSRYVRDEATYALDQDKLVPVAIENVKLPFRFKGVHTLSLIDWDGSKEFMEYRRLVDDISTILGPSHTVVAAAEEQRRLEAEAQRKAEEQHLREQERQQSEQEARRKPDEAMERLIKFRQTAKSKPGSVFRDTLKDGSQGPEMVVIPAGTFRMGDFQGDGGESERPGHTVRIRKPFAIGGYEVTFEEYDRFAAATGRELRHDEGWGRGQRPVINVSWDDAVEYAKWLSEQTGKRYRLPTEAEWEYAARAGTETEYWWGNEMKSDKANCDKGATRWGGKQTSPVGSFQPNPFGLYDTAGNVWEWVEDCWHDNYNGAPTNGSAWKEEGEGNCGQRVIRGGSWDNGPEFLRSSDRDRDDADIRDGNIGFRLAHDLD